VAKEKLEDYLRVSGYRFKDKLPAESDLANILGVSRGTLREALRVAQQDGLIIQHHGLGTFVNRIFPITENGLADLESLDHLSRRMGWKCQSCEVVIERKPLGEEAAEALAMDTLTPAVHVSLVKVINDNAVAFVKDIIPESIVDCSVLRKGFQGSVLDFLSSNFPGLVYNARSYFLAINASSEISKKINVPIGQSLLLIKEVLYSTDQKAINYSLNYFVSEFFQFYLVRHLA
jgi:GntR family transcriptional regulator